MAISYDSKNKKIVLSMYITFDETSLLRSIVSQKVERIKTKDVSQWVEVNATPPSPVGLLSVGISPGGDRVVVFDAE